jgi:type IV secretory pathway TrbF-like protein
MTTTRIPRYLLVGLSGILIAVLLAGGCILFVSSQSSSNAFAATLQQAVGMTCVQAPSLEHCENQDPELQGCAADAQTIEQADIKGNEFTIGRVERRYSARCQSWWGRVFDTRSGSQANMFITINGTTLSASPTFVSDQYRILYSSMIFDASPTQQVPSITGTLLLDTIATPSSVTLPAIAVPGQ